MHQLQLDKPARNNQSSIDLYSTVSLDWCTAQNVLLPSVHPIPFGNVWWIKWFVIPSVYWATLVISSSCNHNVINLWKEARWTLNFPLVNMYQRPLQKENLNNQGQKRHGEEQIHLHQNYTALSDWRVLIYCSTSITIHRIRQGFTTGCHASQKHMNEIQTLKYQRKTLPWKFHRYQSFNYSGALQNPLNAPLRASCIHPIYSSDNWEDVATLYQRQAVDPANV